MIARIWFPAFLLMIGCMPKPQSAQVIIDQSIESHGGTLYENSIVEFDFRNRHYILKRNQGQFEYHRIFEDSAGTYHDVLDNNGFTRKLNEDLVQVTQEWKQRYSNSVNSVAYFAYLPFGLNDPAANKKLIGEEELKGDMYYKIQVTFDQKGGGKDFEDVFVYWINKNNFRMEYFGYSYLTDGGGTRFREAVDQREKNGILFADYVNYKGAEGSLDVAGLAALYKEDKLEHLSDIRLEKLKVRRFQQAKRK